MDFNPIKVSNDNFPIEKLVSDIRTSITPSKQNTELSDILSTVDTGNKNVIGGVGIQPIKQKFSMEDKISIEETHALVGDTWMSKYPTFKLGRDNAEFAAQNQSGLEQAFNGTLKAGNNIGTVVIGNTAGFVYGLADWARTGNFNSVFDNSFSRTLDDWNTKLNYQLPNYYTKQAQNSGFLGQLMENPMNTIFNDIANGLSFTVGTIASEAIWAYATGGASLAMRGGQLGAKLANAGKWGKMFLGTEKAVDGLRAYKGFMAEPLKNAIRTGQISTKAAKGLAFGGNLINTTRFIATSSGNEAGIEAFHFKKEAEENFYHNFEQMYGRPPEAEEIATAQKDIEQAANGVFMGNMAILGVSNLAMLGGLFGVQSPMSSIQKQINKKVFGVGMNKTAAGWQAVAPTKWNKVARALYIPTSATITEGVFEEAGQGTVTKTANLWVERKYDPKYIGKAIDMMDIAGEAAREQYLTKEGQKDIWIGGIVGILGAKFTKQFSRFKREQKNIEESAVKAMNTVENLKTTLVSDITAGRLSAVAVQMEAQDRAEKKMLEGDVVQAKLAQYDGLLAGFMFSDTYDDSSRLVEDLSMAIDVSQDISTEEKDAFKTALTDLHKTYKKATSFAESIVGSQGRIYGTNKSTQLAKEALTFVLVQGNNSNKLMDESFEEMKAYMSADQSKAFKQSEELSGLGTDARRRLKNASQRYRYLEKKSEAVQKRVKELQAAPKEVEGDRQSRLVEMQNKLIEIESQKLEIRGEVETLAKQLEQTNKLKSTLDDTLGSEVNNIGEFISTDDLLKLDQRLEDLESSYKSMDNFSPTNAKMLNDAMQRYQNAKKSLLDYNSAAGVIAKGKYRPRLANDNIFSNLFTKKDNEKADDYTIEFFNALEANRAKKGVELMEVSQEADVKKLQARVDEITNGKEKEDLTEEEKTELESLLNQITELQKPAQTAEEKDDTPSKEKAIQKRVDRLNAQLSQLQNELDNTEETVVASNTTPATKLKVGDKFTDLDENGKVQTYTVKEKIDNIGSVEEIITEEGRTIKNPYSFSSTTNKSEWNVVKVPAPQSIIDYTIGSDAAFENIITTLEDVKNTPLETFTQQEFAYWLQNNLDALANIKRPSDAPSGFSPLISNSNAKAIYNILTSRPENRIKTLFSTVETVDFKKENAYYEQFKDKIFNLFANSDSNGGWFQLNFGNQKNTEKDGLRRKGYITISRNKLDSFTNSLSSILEDLNNELQKKGYNGSFKVSTSLGRLVESFDNIVIHGANEQEVDKALQVVNEYLISKNIENNIAQKGKDGNLKDGSKSSHTQILAESVKNKEVQNPKSVESSKPKEQTTQTQEQPNPRIKELKTQIANIKKEINRLSPQTENQPLDTVEALKQRIDNILKLFKAEFVGMDNIEEKIKNKPDQKDIERYRELLEKGEETEEFQALKEKLSQWRVYDSLAENDNESIADLLDQVASLQTQVEELQTLEATPEFDKNSDLDTNKSGKVDNFQLTQNTNFPPTLKVKDGNIIVLTHLRPSTIIAKFQNPQNIQVNGEEMGLENLKQGDKITFEDNGLNRTFIIGTGMSIELAKEDFLAIPNLITTNNLTDKLVNWSYSVLYETNNKGEVAPLKSDFADDLITGHTNDLKQGDTVELYVDVNHPYNKKLIAKGDVTDILNNTVVFIRKEGQNYQTLKSLQGRVSNDTIKTIRKAAAKQLKTGKSAQIGTTKIERVELGVPVLTVTENGAVTTIPITNNGTQNIVATGYVQNGEITLNKPIEEIRKSYVSKYSKANKDKKIPIVIIKQGKQNIAFPISLVKTSNPQGDKMQDIFNNDNLNDAQKAVAINKLLADNNISPRRFDLVAQDMANAEKLQDIENVLNDIKSFKSADDLADKNYKKENLEFDAEISLDLENLNVYLPSQKLLISFEEVQLSKEVPLKQEVENKAKTQKANRNSSVSKKVDGLISLNFVPTTDLIQQIKDSEQLSALFTKSQLEELKDGKEVTLKLNNEDSVLATTVLGATLPNRRTITSKGNVKRAAEIATKNKTTVPTKEVEDDEKKLKKATKDRVEKIREKKERNEKLTKEEQQIFEAIEIDSENAEEIVRVDDLTPMSKLEEIAKKMKYNNDNFDLLSDEDRAIWDNAKGEVNKIINDYLAEQRKLQTKTVSATKPKSKDNSLSYPNYTVDMSEYKKGDMLRMFKKEDGDWYFMDSNGREQKDTKNRYFHDWLHEKIGQGNTITNQDSKDQKQEFKEIQEIKDTNSEIECNK